jgi:hypothetical protein
MQFNSTTVTFPAHLSFWIKQLSFHLGATLEGPESRSISVVVELRADQYVRTPDKRSLHDAKWSIRLLEFDAYHEEPESEGNIGYLSYLPEIKSDYDVMAESCSASVALDHATFQSLLDTLLSGRLPDWISLNIKGLTFGGAPDGSEKIWDITANMNLPIVDISVRFPILVSPQTSPKAFDDEIPQETLSATSQDIKVAGEQLGKLITEKHSDSLRQLRFIAAIATLLVIVLLFK